MFAAFTRKDFASLALLGMSLTPLFAASAVDARTLPLRIARAQQAAASAAMLAPALRSTRVFTFAPRTAVAPDTAPSAKYYQLTNITARVHGTEGIALAVNNDGRIAYTDFGEPFPTAAESAYIVNNGGTFGRLVHPNYGKPTALAAYALNENAEAVGGLQTFDEDGEWTETGNVAWTLSGSTSSTVAYFGIFDEQSAYAVNNYNVSVGGDESAELFEPSASPHGKTIELPGLAIKPCAFSPSVASAINDAGEIVGSSCNRAVRFSTTSSAQQLPVSTQNVSSSAEAINEAGDVAGYAGKYAFLYHGGRTTYLPLPSGDQGKVSASVGFAINSTDEVVGTLYSIVGRLNWFSAFLYHNGKSYDLNALIAPNTGWQIVDAYGINDRGEIVGDALYNSKLYGISLKPPQ